MIYIFFPPLKGPSGGIYVLSQLAKRLLESSLPVRMLLWEKPRESIVSILQELPCTFLNEVQMSSEDLYIVPEGWVNALSPGLQQKAKCFVYCQNWAYLFHGLPEGISWGDLDVDFLAVSQPVAVFLEKALGKGVQIIRPAIDREMFYPPVAKPKSGVRIGYMPRKNKALMEQVRRIFRERNPEQKVQWVAIEGMDQSEVASTLQTCHIFLCTGFPEGFSLPPLEAMACACLPIGFTGYGGWDYMRQFQNKETDPDSLLREVSWKGNGLWSPDGDTLSMALDLERAIYWWQYEPETFQKILAEGQKASTAYNKDEQRKEVLEILN
jgi:hypothetical protein